MENLKGNGKIGKVFFFPPSLSKRIKHSFIITDKTLQPHAAEAFLYCPATRQGYDINLMLPINHG